MTVSKHWNGTAWEPIGRMGPQGPPGADGVSDHGALSGLNDPDHPISAVQGLSEALQDKISLIADLDNYTPDVGEGLAISTPSNTRKVVLDTSGVHFDIDFTEQYKDSVVDNNIGGIYLIAEQELEFSSNTYYIALHPAEGYNTVITRLALNTDGDAFNKTIKNMKDPVDNLDTANKQYVDSSYWDFWKVPVVSGMYSSNNVSATLAIRSEAVEYPNMFVPAKDGTIDRIAAAVTVIGSTGAKFRFGIRSWDIATARPGALLVDTGVVAADVSTGKVEAIVSPGLAVKAGVPLISTVTIQGAATTRPQTTNQVMSHPLAMTSAFGYSNTLWVGNGTTGALPINQNWTLTDSSSIKTWVRFV